MPSGISDFRSTLRIERTIRATNSRCEYSCSSVNVRTWFARRTRESNETTWYCNERVQIVEIYLIDDDGCETRVNKVVGDTCIERCSSKNETLKKRTIHDYADYSDYAD